MEGSWVPYTITLFGASGILLGLAPNVLVGGLAMFLAGLFWLLTLATLNATAQLMSPSWIRGRAMSIYSLAFAGVIPIGSILAGLTRRPGGHSRVVAASSPPVPSPWACSPPVSTCPTSMPW